MLRSLYGLTLRLHPSRFRDEFAGEMLWIFDQAGSARQRTSLCADAVLSLLRQWTIRGGYRDLAAPAKGPPAPLPGAPSFSSVQPLHIRAGTLVKGGALALANFVLVSIIVSVGATPRRNAGAIVLPGGAAAPEPLFSAPDSTVQPAPAKAAPPVHESHRAASDAPSPATAVANPRFFIVEVLDLNQDSKISFYEMRRAPETLRALDSDRDGSLDPFECGQDPRGPSNPVYQALDQDGDHSISPTEIIAATPHLLALDANHDGMLSGHELQPTKLQ